MENGGRADRLDTDPVFGSETPDQDRDMEIVMANLKLFKEKLETMSEEYTAETFNQDMQDCYARDVLEDNPKLRNRIANRLNRLFWKLLVPLHEGNSRGVTQSSIWGNIAATIWARDSSKKPYWPALCLGILPSEDQREGWHDAVTERNEARLPEKLRSQLETAKRKCMQSQKRHSLRYFLVEFLGTYLFIWVRETDIVENFDSNKKTAPFQEDADFVECRVLLVRRPTPRCWKSVFGRMKNTAAREARSWWRVRSEARRLKTWRRPIRMTIQTQQIHISYGVEHISQSKARLDHSGAQQTS
jgi:hypothetical protein